jgi:RNA polymerase sigma-70 factor (ECF subfamily)
VDRTATLRLVAGDSAARKPSALEEDVVRLFDQWRGPLLRYLVSTGVTAQDGEEVVQETFLALFQHLQRGRPRDNLRGWIFKVGHTLALKMRRREASVPSEGLDFQASDPNPEQQAWRNQRRRQLLAVISALPERDRDCLTLRAEGLRYREIAGVLGISLASVANSLERSLERMSRADEKWR